MVVLNCPLANCDFHTDDVDVIGAAAILNLHAHEHSNPTPVLAQPIASTPKLVRPKVEQNSTGEDWNAFLRRWETFRIGSHIADAAASTQLFECATEQLGNIVLRAHPTFTSKPLAEALTILKSIAVVPVALGVLRSDLSSMRQDPDEPFRTFAARVQGKAETCEFKTNFEITCDTCENVLHGETYYTDDAIRDVLLNGIADIEIRREALSSDGIQTKSIAETIAFVENRETARNANTNNPSSQVSAVSEYRRSLRDSKNDNHRDNRPRMPSPSKFDQSKTASCPDCGSTFHLFTKKARGWNRKPFTRCQPCWKKQNAKSKQQSTAGSINVVEDDVFGQISAINIPTGSSKQKSHTLNHQIFSKGEWKKAKINAHPKVSLKLSLDNQTPGQIDISSIADSGAQSDLWSLDQYLNAGFRKSDLLPVSLSCKAANHSPIHIEGAFRAVLKGRSKSGNMITCRTLIYVSRDVKTMYLSYETMLSLGIVNHEFPSVGQFMNPSTQPSKPDVDQPTSSDIFETNVEVTCDCPRRTPVPPRPTRLPFECTEENIPKMRDWLLTTFAGSTFNTCPHQPLPTMTGPPVEIHLKEDAKPVARHKAIPVPIHWQEQVRQDLFRDESLGVIERVPYGEPSQWCHRMVVTRKHDGSPRRTVDLSPLNKHCKRETHNAESPFHLARRIPRNTWKTVTDAWNGFHSVPLRESDRHLTTFITTHGRWRYKRAPQGFLSSGDGYNRRFDAILADFDRKERIVDDTLFYDNELQEHWWRTIDFLITVGNAGIVLNPDTSKFQFACREVDFAGFHITSERIDPLPKYYNAIKNFPTPKSTTDIRSWFGLVS